MLVSGTVIAGCSGWSCRSWVAATTDASPSSRRDRSTRWVACSTIWPPPRRSSCHHAGAGQAVVPVAGQQADRALGDHLVDLAQRVHRPPVVRDAGDEATLPDRGLDPDGRLEVGGERLLDHQVDSALDQRRLERRRAGRAAGRPRPRPAAPRRASPELVVRTPAEAPRRLVGLPGPPARGCPASSTPGSADSTSRCRWAMNPGPMTPREWVVPRSTSCSGRKRSPPRRHIGWPPDVPRRRLWYACHGTAPTNPSHDDRRPGRPHPATRPAPGRRAGRARAGRLRPRRRRGHVERGRVRGRPGARAGRPVGGRGRLAHARSRRPRRARRRRPAAPGRSASRGPSGSADPGASAPPSVAPEPTPTPRPERPPVNVDIEPHPDADVRERGSATPGARPRPSRSRSTSTAGGAGPTPAAPSRPSCASSRWRSRPAATARTAAPGRSG